MNKQKKYPYILDNLSTSSSNQIVLMHREDLAIHLFGANKGEIVDDYNQDWCKDITREYLTHTYGKLESPEHAEFIIKLAENGGFYYNEDGKTKNYFCFNDSMLFFSKHESDALFCSEKLITIPMPPKTDFDEVKKLESGIKYWNGKEPLEVGMVVNAFEVQSEILKIRTNDSGDTVYAVMHIIGGRLCWSDINNIKPVDTRTDKEKAIDDIKAKLEKRISRSIDNVLSKAYDEWVGK